MDDLEKESLINKLNDVDQQYFRLVLIVGKPESGKTRALSVLSEKYDVPVTSVNRALCQQLLDQPEKERKLRASEILGDLVQGMKGDPILLDNTEVLFDPSLYLNPLKALQSVSRNKRIVASWSGEIVDSHLIYAQPDHPEYNRSDIKDLVYVDLNEKK